MLATVQTNVSHFHHHHTGCQKKKGKKGKSHIHHWIGSLSPWVPSVMSGMLPLCYLLMKKGTENVSATFCSDTSLKIGVGGDRIWIYQVRVEPNQMLVGHQVSPFHKWIKYHDIPFMGFSWNVVITPLECLSSGLTTLTCPPNCMGWLGGVKCKLVGHFRVLLHQIKCDECDVKMHSRVITVAGIRWSIGVPL